MIVMFLFSADRFLLSINLSTISLLCICTEFEVLPAPPIVLFPLLEAKEVFPLLRVELFVWSLIEGCEFNIRA